MHENTQLSTGGESGDHQMLLTRFRAAVSGPCTKPAERRTMLPPSPAPHFLRHQPLPCSFTAPTAQLQALKLTLPASFTTARLIQPQASANDFKL
jgi:hypothetical protein